MEKEKDFLTQKYFLWYNGGKRYFYLLGHQRNFLANIYKESHE